MSDAQTHMLLKTWHISASPPNMNKVPAVS